MQHLGYWSYYWWFFHTHLDSFNQIDEPNTQFLWASMPTARTCKLLWRLTASPEVPRSKNIISLPPREIISNAWLLQRDTEALQKLHSPASRYVWGDWYTLFFHLCSRASYMVRLMLDFTWSSSSFNFFHFLFNFLIL